MPLTPFDITAAAPTRRRLLKSAAGAAAAAAASLLMPPNVRRALAQDSPKRALLRDIKHVVILMQENRSFDHYFGTMSGVRGFDDPAALKLENGRSVFYQPDAENPEGYMLPFHLDTGASSAQKIPSTSHAWAVQHEAWNGGRMDKWLPAHRKADGVKAPYVMSYYKREDIPFQFALAEAFTICDAYHCSVMGPTHPNRMYLMTGMIDPEGTGRGPIIRNIAPEGGYTWTTYPERLEQAGVSWKVYQQENNYGCNMLEKFKVFQQAPVGSPLHTRGVLRGPEGQFEYDAAHDKLPAVSWIIPTNFQSEHPDFMPADGAAFVASKIDAIASNPDVWAKTVFILNYDENDGIFDHVAPPVPPPGTPREFVDGLPIGARIPRPVHHRVTLDRRRLGMQRTVRPYVGPPVPGNLYRRTRAKRHRLAASQFWRPDLAVSLRPRGEKAARATRYQRPPHPCPIHLNPSARTCPARQESEPPGAGKRPAPSSR